MTIEPNTRRPKEANFTDIIQSHRDRIYRICCCYVSDEEARKDVFQQVLINIWCSLDAFESRAQIGTWIYRIATNTCLGYLRSEKRRRGVFEDQTTMDMGNVQDSSNDEERHQREEDIQRLYNCIVQLEPVNRALISLYLEDISTQEMADILGISEVNVRVKLHRVKNSLKTMMERDSHGNG